MTPTGMPAALAFMTDCFSASASGIDTTMRIGLLGDRRVDQVRHLHHVEGLRRVVLDLGAHRLLAGLDAVLDDRPVDVVRLAVGDEDDVDVGGFLGVGGRRSGNRDGAEREGRGADREALPAIPFSCSSTKLSLSGSERWRRGLPVLEGRALQDLGAHGCEVDPSARANSSGLAGRGLASFGGPARRISSRNGACR